MQTPGLLSQAGCFFAYRSVRIVIHPPLSHLKIKQDWVRGETSEGVMDILYNHSPYGIQVHFPKWALGEHASEAVKSLAL